MTQKYSALVIIPARAGSKGIPSKNSKLLAGKPLVSYTLECALDIALPENICVSTNDPEIISITENHGISVPFIRPDHLANDTATTESVILHALDFYALQGKTYEVVILLQVTSPLRTITHIQEACALYSNAIDMVVSVKESPKTHLLCKENTEGFLEQIIQSNTTRRQDSETVYEYNGAIYILNVQSIQEKGLAGCTKRIKYCMPEEYSIDIDTEFDWKLTECILQKS